MDIPGSTQGEEGPDQLAGADAAANNMAEPADQASSDFAPGAEPAGGSAQAATPPRSANLLGPLLVYTLLRLVLIVALTALLMFFMPLIVALLFAIIVQLPLSWLLFTGQRRRLNDAIAQSSAHRRSERAKLQSALSGNEPPADL
jgi:small-conductance mechanosensitive channel